MLVNLQSSSGECRTWRWNSRWGQVSWGIQSKWEFDWPRLASCQICRRLKKCSRIFNGEVWVRRCWWFFERAYFRLHSRTWWRPHRCFSVFHSGRHELCPLPVGWHGPRWYLANLRRRRVLWSDFLWWSARWSNRLDWTQFLRLRFAISNVCKFHLKF